MTENKLKEMESAINSISNEKQTSPNLTREQILEKAHLKGVPKEFKNKYVDLLFEYKAALSVSKTDLGRAKDFFHKIHHKYNEPVYQKQFKIPDAHNEFISKSIGEWLKLGVVKRSSSMYNSPIFVSLKRTEMVSELYKISES